MKLEGLKDQKVTKPKFSEKRSFLGKKPKHSSKVEFFGFCLKFNSLMCLFFALKRVDDSVLYNFAKKKKHIWEKSGFSFMT